MRNEEFGLRRIAIAVMTAMLIAASRTFADDGEAARKIYTSATPSLVVVNYVWQSELGRQEIFGAGVVVSEDGLVISSIAVFDQRIPDEQMTDFKIVIPSESGDDDELDAEFVGRDERTNLALVKCKSPHKWQPLKFENVEPKVGDRVYSVGLLPKAAGYRPYLQQAIVSAKLRGEIPQVLVADEGLAALSSPVFDAQGRAIGLVGFQEGQPVILNDQRTAMMGVINPPKIFMPASEFLLSLTDPPVAGKPQPLPWIGVPELHGVPKDLAEYLGLENQPAIEIGDVIPNSPADKAGLKAKQVIVKLNGQPIVRGDDPEELPLIFRRSLLKLKPGEVVTLTVLTGKDEPAKDIKITLEEQPRRANLAKRFWAEDLGFSAREVVFYDTYYRRLPADAKGVIIALIKPQGSAQNGGLRRDDLVTQLNGKPVTDLEQFKSAYQEARKASKSQQIVLVVLREGKEETIRIEPPQ